uniref:Uncharacterized protein n=1 Tax=Populus trichocarpa TaxID=3694 RepID=A0A2K1YHG1_POPTR
MAFVAACICGIFCLPSLSTNSEVVLLVPRPVSCDAGLLGYVVLQFWMYWDLSQGSLDWLFCPSPGYTCLCLLFELSVSWSFYLLQFCVICWPSWAGLGCCSMQPGLLLYTALFAVCCSAAQGTLHLPMGVQVADDIHCWNGFAYLGFFTGVIACDVLITLLGLVLLFAPVCLSFLRVLAGWPGPPCCLVLAALFLGSYGDCSHYALFVDALDPISLAWYAVFLEVGWTLCFLKLAGLMGARAIVSGSFLLLVLSLALVGGGLILMDVVLHERCLLLLGFGLLTSLKLFICQRLMAVGANV